MNLSRKNILFVTLFLSLTTSLFSTTYYVDAVNGSNSGSGKSASYAWKTISKVNSVSFSPGDKILFKRGCTWKETLIIKNNGTSSYPIIFGSYGSGNLPVIDGGGSRENCIYVSGKSNIIIQEFRLTNTSKASGSGAVRIKYSSKITVKNCSIYVTGRAAVLVENSSYCNILKNTVSTPSNYYNMQTDGIYAQRNSYNIYDGNKIIISNTHTYQHCDAIQLYYDKYAVIRNNYVEQKNYKTGNAQGIYVTQPVGGYKIFNNVCYGMYTTSSLLKFKTSSSSTAQIIGNTIYGGKSQLFITNDPNIVFKNNIIYTTGNSIPVTFEKAISNKSNVNYNIYRRYYTGKSIISYAGSYRTMSQWRSIGFDSNGKETDPQFKDPSAKDFKLKSTSPALNKGVTLSAPYNLDILGTKRPTGTSSDIGAYEMVNLGKSDESENSVSPGTFELSQNYPNPFNPATRIKFSLPVEGEISLKIFDILGSEVKVLASGFFNAGTYEYSFDASILSSGTYIYVLKAENFIQSKKMLLLK